MCGFLFNFSCVEAVAMAANISKHTKYLTSTIHYITDQVTLNSSLLDIQVTLFVYWFVGNRKKNFFGGGGGK